MNLLNTETVFSHSNNEDFTSTTTSLQRCTAGNNSSNPRVYSTAGPNAKILGSDQSVRNFPEVAANKANFNLSLNTNTLSSNALLNTKNSKTMNPFSAIEDSASGFADLATFASLASSRSFMLDSHPAVITSSVSGSNSLDYDAASSLSRTLSTSKEDKSLITSSSTFVKKGSSSEVFIGSRENTPKVINSAY